ncbi:MAG: hypothetical protein D6784_13290 [Chloroflexi bacterium]|nr:MAG: hypothetical protein D6784_13290 [Chloroflexota bacterium]
MDLIPTILLWWFILAVFGLVGWLTAYSLLGNLPDRGFAFARPVGLLLTGYILWLGGSFRLLRNDTAGVLTALLILLVLGWLWLTRARRGLSALRDWLGREWPYALAVEVLFAVAFAGWAVYKAYNPNIETAGGEKWMEIAFINGTLRSDYFPPHDPWLSGFAISYYYFGYVLMAMLTRLSGLPAHVAFNLYIPTLFAMTLTGAMGLLANLVALYRARPDQPPRLTRPTVLAGLTASLFVGVMGHLEGLLEVLHKRGLLSPQFWIWLDIRDLKIPPAGPGDSWIPDRFIWWWRASRVLTDYTLTGQEQEVIDEFPFFSFLLGDVHPHVLALPFVLLAVALALNLLVSRRGDLPETGPEAGFVPRMWAVVRQGGQGIIQAAGGRPALLAYAVCIGGLSFLNTWDFPIYLGVTGFAFVLWLFWSAPQQPAASGSDIDRFILPGLVGTGLLGVVGVLLYLPFYATFSSQARGILPNLWNPTRLPQFFVFFGPFLVAAVGFLVLLTRRRRGWQKELAWTLPAAWLGPVLVMLAVTAAILLSEAGRAYIQGILSNPEVQAVLSEASVGGLVQEALQRRLLNPWTFLLLGGLLGWSLALAVAARPTDPPGEPVPARLVLRFVLVLLTIGLLLPLTVEFIYLRDNFGIRMNTVFKFYFQAWVLLALTAAFAVYYVSSTTRGLWVRLWQVGMVGLVGASMLYPVLAVYNKTDGFSRSPTLDGIAWLADVHPADYAAIQWLRANAPDDAVILEAPGDRFAAYQYVGRVSALTGLQTLLGWGGHESQWRGNYEEPARREPDIDTLYTTTDLQLAQKLLDKYNITYVYVGPLEQERYPPAGLRKFDRLLKVVYQQDGVTIYRRD